MPNLLDLNLQDNTEQGIFQSGDYGFYIAQNMIDAEAGGSNSILSCDCGLLLGSAVSDSNFCFYP